MTLDEAIKHCEEVAEDMELCCSECAEEHRQLAEWLKELKESQKKTGVIIKGLNMPNKCIGCYFMKIVTNAHVMCSFYPEKGDINMTDEIPDWCPLEEVNKNGT